MKEFNTALEFAQDMIDYFWLKPERKCINNKGECVYQPSPTSEGCVIGRHLPIEASKLFDEDGLSIAFCIDVKPELIPEWMKKLDRPFLNMCQCLHDRNHLAKGNKELVAEILKSFLDVSLLKFPE